MTKSLNLSGISAHYGRTQVLKDLDLDVKAGELVSLLGASGCGKTTTLRLIAGFLQATGGQVLLDGQDISGVAAHRRDIGLVFQNYALFPHMSVADNVGFGLKQRGVAGPERGARVDEMLGKVGLDAFSDRLPAALSGGQKQRVALARALVIKPSLLLFDEPLSNLDAKLRVDMRVEIRELQRAHDITAIYVTHDQEEAFSISDRVAIMDAGQISQYDTPETLYRRPANAFVANFVGFETMIDLRVTGRSGGHVSVEGRGANFSLDENVWGSVPDAFTLGARADGLRVVEANESEGLPATLTVRTYLGRSYHYRAETPLGSVLANGPIDRHFSEGDQARLVLVPEQCCILPATA
ncbi:MAG: ABC transporter ATP-binding protein [Pseudomonadota bacterium]